MQKGQVQIILIGVLVLVVAIGIFFLGRTTAPKSPASRGEQPQNVATSSPQPSPTSPVDETANWKTYNGQFVTFKYPSLWNPTKRELFGGAILEDAHLGIPTVTSDQSLGFSGVSLESAKPNDVVSEQAIIIGGKSGFKWIRKGDNYISYDYITRGYNNKGVFNIHVTGASEDKSLETQLDILAKSVIFK